MNRPLILAPATVAPATAAIAAMALGALSLPTLVAGQQAAADTGPPIDPPARVARLSYILGEVSLQTADGQAPEAAVLNRPVTIGDRLLTGGAARSELTMGIAAVRLDAFTDLSVANLDADIVHLELNSGTVGVHVRALAQGEIFQIDTPNAAVALLEPGDYRVEVDSTGTVFLDVRAGLAELDAGSGTVQAGSGDQALLRTGERLATLRALGRTDDFDAWSAGRERQLSGGETIRHVSREVVGYEELDRHGSWRAERDYGPVWIPRVSAGWAPYRFGHWTWISPWGWTWIDDAPWGFAPFHYGRWTYLHSRWCWIPGPRHYRPVYAPALVGWVGSPYSGISISVSSGPVGWFPLGPREVYVPYRRTSPRYLRNVNVSNTVIVNNTYITNVARGRVNGIRYVNRDRPGAVTRAPRRDFDARRPVENRRQWRTDRDSANRRAESRTDSRQPRAVSRPRQQTERPARGTAQVARPSYTAPANRGHTSRNPSRAGRVNEPPTVRRANVAQRQPPPTARREQAQQRRDGANRSPAASRTIPAQRAARTPRAAPTQRTTPTPRAAPKRRTTSAPRAAPAPRTRTERADNRPRAQTARGSRQDGQNSGNPRRGRDQNRDRRGERR
jgi:hypothetical protein